LATVAKGARGVSPTRRAMESLLQETPGLSLSEVCRALHVGWGTVQYHVNTLRREGILGTVQVLGKRVLYFHGEDAQASRAKAVLRHHRLRRIYDEVQRLPGLTEKQLVQRSGLARKAAHNYLELLQELALIEATNSDEGRRYQARLQVT